MIIGPGWPFLGLVLTGIVALLLLPGCGLVVVDKAPTYRLRVDAPTLVEVDPRVAAVPAQPLPGRRAKVATRRS